MMQGGGRIPGDERDESGEYDPAIEDAYDAEEQLTLADDDDALPWLESEDDVEEDDGFNARMIVFAALGLLVVGAILFAAWYLLGSLRDNGMEPDGSTIEAPDEPYKTRPENPGGTVVAGTGDMSYEVGEGQGREGRLAETAPAPSIDLEQADAPEAAEATESPAPSAGVGVQIGAFSTRESAQAGWSQLRGRFEALQGLDHRILEGRADSGTIYRLQAIAGNADAADAVCSSIRDAGGDCQVKR